ELLGRAVAFGAVANLVGLPAEPQTGPLVLAGLVGTVSYQADGYVGQFAVYRAPKELSRGAGDLRSTLYEQLQRRLRQPRSHYQMALWVIVPASVVGLLLTIGLMRSFYSWVFNPIRDLEAGVRRVALGDFDQRLDVHSGDEMEELAD